MRVACSSAVFSAPAGGETTPVTLRLLLVDDSPELLESAVRLLRRLPSVAVRCVMSAEDALAELERFNPDIMVLDLMLLDMDGLKVAQKVKQRPRPPKVVILSPSDDLKCWDAARASGVDRLISKRRLFVELLHCIGTLLRQIPAKPMPIRRTA